MDRSHGYGKPTPIEQIEQLRQRVHELETQLAKNIPLLDEAANHIDAMENYIDDVCTVICDPYRWCDNIDVLRKIEKLLRDGAKLLGDAKMSITSERLREHFNHDVTDAAADEIDALEKSECNAWKTVAKLRHSIDKLTAERDELLAALHKCATAVSSAHVGLIVDAAIASVKEKQNAAD